MLPDFLDIREYSYELPEERIAMHPLPQRDDAKLLHYMQGRITHLSFRQLASLLPEPASMFFNETRVIPARFHFEKQTGAVIEVLLLNPAASLSNLGASLSSEERTTWSCMIGNLKRWPDKETLVKSAGGITLEARLTDRAAGLVTFSWTPGVKFVQVLHAVGEVPLPPYIKRPPDDKDRERYQTIYSHVDGAVAAPTAGLHFTEDVMRSIGKRKVTIDYLTLHVGAGTFMPVKVRNAMDHPMHSEKIVVRKSNLVNLLKGEPVIAVGTTALRTLESVYWFGVLLRKDPAAPFIVDSFTPYREAQIPTDEALRAVLFLMESQNLEEIFGETSIFILPGYTFKVCDGLITNFHQPGSTLLLLIAAFTGGDWKKIYTEALAHNYRFLSYGDSSFIVRDNSLIV